MLLYVRRSPLPIYVFYAGSGFSEAVYYSVVEQRWNWPVCVCVCRNANCFLCAKYYVPAQVLIMVCDNKNSKKEKKKKIKTIFIESIPIFTPLLFFFPVVLYRQNVAQRSSLWVGILYLCIYFSAPRSYVGNNNIYRDCVISSQRRRSALTRNENGQRHCSIFGRDLNVRCCLVRASRSRCCARSKKLVLINLICVYFMVLVVYEFVDLTYYVYIPHESEWAT